MRRLVWAAIAVAALGACGGTTLTDGNGGPDGGSSSSSGGSSSSGSSSSGSGSGSSSGSSGGASSGSSGSSSGGTGRVPVNHRPDDSQCQQPAPAGDCQIMSGGPGECHADADCADAGVNGRCIESMGGAIYCRCTSDACAGDSSCPTGQTCACHGAPYTGGDGNACVPGNCRVDADCGPGGYCSPSYQVQGCGGLAGYYCHTPTDTCVDDSDCATSTSGPQVCAYSTTAGHWKCQQQSLCP